MTRRTYLEWHLVGESDDPVPADDWDVREVAQQFADRGSVMQSAATTLERFADTDEWTGEAAQQFADKAAEAHSDLGKAADRYVDAGRALTTYAEAVADARRETFGAVQDAVIAENQRVANATSELAGIDEPTEADRDADERRRGRLDAAEQALTDARTRLRNAMDALATAADTCRRAINAASGHFKDSRMDDIKGAVSAVIKVLVDALTLVAIVVAVVLIVLLIVATGGGALAALIPLLMTASLWLGGAIFALTTVQFLMGDASFGEWMLSLVGFAGGALTGRLAAAGSRLVATARTSIVVRAADQAIDNLPFLVRMSQRVPFAPIANWGARREGAIVADAVFDALSRTSPTALATRLSTALRGLELTEAVHSIRSIQMMRGLSLTPFEVTTLTQALHQSVGSLFASGGQLTSLVADIVKSPGTVTGLPGAATDLPGQAADALDGTPARDLPEPAPVRVTPVGR